jgi:hypothetical protein
MFKNMREWIPLDMLTGPYGINEPLPCIWYTAARAIVVINPNDLTSVTVNTYTRAYNNNNM